MEYDALIRRELNSSEYFNSVSRFECWEVRKRKWSVQWHHTSYVAADESSV